MPELELMGRAIDCWPRDSQLETKDKQWFSLCETAGFCNLPVHEVKEAIRKGCLKARHAGRTMIAREDMIKFIVEVTGKSIVRVRYDLSHT